MALNTFFPPEPQFFKNGAPLSGGNIYTYEPGTNTPKPTYSDREGTVENTNPVTIDSEGYPETDIYLSGAYKIVIKDADGVTVYTRDNFTGSPTFPVDDDIALFNDPADDTKQIRLDAGNVSTGTVRVLTMPDKDVTPADTGSANTWTGAQSFDDTSTFSDVADNTKKVRLDAGNVSTGTTRALTLPDADVSISSYGATLVDDTDAATARTTLGLGTASTQDTGKTVGDIAAYEDDGSSNPILNAPNPLYVASDRTITILQRDFAQDGTIISTTTVIPYDNTIPQITEGAQALSITMTPKRADSRIRIRAVLHARAASNGILTTAALFMSGVSNALAANSRLGDGAAPSPGVSALSVEADIASPGTTSQTFSARFGPHTAATVYLNASSSGLQVFNGVSASTLEFEEYLP